MQSSRREKLPCPVIGVGNITLGGTGKTALTSLLSKRLEKMGYKVAILCTGYGGRMEGKVEGRTPEEVGDEAFLLAKSLERGNVWAGRDRLRMAKDALREGAEVIILDDAMQYFKIQKDLEIVMLNALSPFGYGYLFPRGALREPLRGLKRADIIILNNAELGNKEEISRRIAKFNSSAKFFEASYHPVELVSIPDGMKKPLEWLRGKRIMGVAGIGSPEGFQRTLENLAREVIFRPFPDHHRFIREEVMALQKEAQDKGCEALVITEKDGVKIKGLLDRSSHSPIPIFILSVELKVYQEEELWKKIEEILRRG